MFNKVLKTLFTNSTPLNAMVFIALLYIIILPILENVYSLECTKSMGTTYSVMMFIVITYFIVQILKSFLYALLLPFEDD